MVERHVLLSDSADKFAVESREACNRMKSTVALLFDVAIIDVNGDFDANVDCTSAKFNTLHTRNCSQSLNLVREIMVWVVLTDWLAK